MVNFGLNLTNEIYMSAKSLTIALLQQENSTDVEQNVSRTFSSIREAVQSGANVICLQEMFDTIYFCHDSRAEYFSMARGDGDRLFKDMKELAAELEVVLIVPYFEKRAAGIYHNSAVVIDADGTQLGKYRKMHIPDDPGFEEKYYFTPGDLGYRVFETRYGTIGVLICWDQWFPEAARLTAMQGADILFYPTAIGVLEEEGEEELKQFHSAWQTIQRSHAVANGCFVASVNRAGTENGTRFWGKSFVAGPFGEILSEAGSEEEILLTTINLADIEPQRQTWPFFRDRRVDSYEGLVKRFLD